MSINKQPVYKFTLAFKDSGGLEREMTVRTEQTAWAEANPRGLIVLHALRNPKRATVLDVVPGRPEFTVSGEIQPHGIWRAVGTMLLPLVACMVVAGGLAWKFLWR